MLCQGEEASEREEDRIEKGRRVKRRKKGEKRELYCDNYRLFILIL